MREKIIYKNHINESIAFGDADAFANENTLHDFEWTVTSKNNKISSLDKKVQKKSIPVIIKCNSDSEGIALRNRLFEICEKDVLALKHGNLIIGDYYMKCFVTACKYSGYTQSKQYAKLTLTIQTDYPYWVKETTTTFGLSGAVVGSNLDYNNDFPYDYSPNVLSDKLRNTDFVPTNFRMKIYGPCNNPSVYIGGHEYTVNKDVAEGEYLTIDSVDKTIVLTDIDGNETNCFNLRNKDSYIFEKIPVGESNVSSSTSFVFEVVLLEERGVPKWI